ncbi:outer membrane beta-barrel protein [Mucilaginibacter antarcticus]|uniref:Outer membrane beta-barrel protein n=1 Tax=Mucilaginibacter antarcticus TaxID=1855725 RepID=A0ABW5XQX7_9SPHI
MKKITITLALLIGVTLSTFAQQAAKGIFSIGINGGIPTGTTSDVSSFTIGGDLKYDHPIATNTFFTTSAGYTYFPYKSSITSALKSVGIDKSGTGFVPLKVGAKYFINPQFYTEGQVGAAISTESGGGTGFAYAPGIGIKFSNHADLGIRYEGWTKDGETISQFAFRLGIGF